MFAKIFLVGLFVSANARYILVEDLPVYQDYEPALYEEFDHPRYRRQAQGSVSFDNKGNMDIGGKVPLARDDRNVLSAIGSASMNNKLNSYGAGLALDNVNGHGLSLSAKEIPDFGRQITGAGRLNLINTNNHNLDANAFVTRNMPTKFPNVPNFNTVGGNLDYTFKDRIGANVGLAHTKFLERTDLSAGGRLNLFKNPTSSFDFNAGASRSFAPYIPKSRWEPNFGFTFNKSF